MARKHRVLIANQRNNQHKGTEHLAIHSTVCRRMIALLALKTTARFYTPLGSCFPISKHKIIKTGPHVHLTEAVTTKFVAENTLIPVPNIYCSFLHKKRAYIVMERIQGDKIPIAWKKLSDASRQKVFDQLRDILRELRGLEPPLGTGIESCADGSLRDSRNPRSCPRFGSFKTIQEFHLWLRDGLQPSTLKEREDDQDWLDIRDMADKQDKPWPPPVFTHADLNPFNILVRGDKVVGIIDWELSGWYPLYWEDTSEWLGSVVRTEWQGSIDKFLDPFPEVLKMEVTRQRWWGEF